MPMKKSKVKKPEDTLSIALTRPKRSIKESIKENNSEDEYDFNIDEVNKSKKIEKTESKSKRKIKEKDTEEVEDSSKSKSKRRIAITPTSQHRLSISQSPRSSQKEKNISKDINNISTDDIKFIHKRPKNVYTSKQFQHEDFTHSDIDDDQDEGIPISPAAKKIKPKPIKKVSSENIYSYDKLPQPIKDAKEYWNKIDESQIEVQPEEEFYSSQISFSD